MYTRCTRSSFSSSHCDALAGQVPSSSAVSGGASSACGSSFSSRRRPLLRRLLSMRALSCPPVIPGRGSVFPRPADLRRQQHKHAQRKATPPTIDAKPTTSACWCARMSGVEASSELASCRLAVEAGSNSASWMFFRNLAMCSRHLVIELHS